jgi:antitoxin VapB
MPNMPFHIRDAETDHLARKVAAQKGVGITQAVKEALQAEMERGRLSDAEFLRQIEAIQTPSSSGACESGSAEDKAFFDDLWGDRE